jgi:predicted HTH domain antitoxin
MKTIHLTVPQALLLDPLRTLAGIEKRSQLLLSVKYFELGELSSGQAASMCELSRTAFLTEASHLGVAVAELSPEELESEFGHA